MRKFRAVALIVALTASLSLWASAKTHTAGIVLTNAAQLNGKQLEAGNYKVRWEGDGPAVEVSILQGKNVVATGSANVQEAASAAHDDSVTLSGDGDSRSISSIAFQGKKTVLVFGGESSAAGK